MALAGLGLAALCLATSLTLVRVATPLPGTRLTTELYQLPTASGCSYVFKLRSRFERPQAWAPESWVGRLGRLASDVHVWGQGGRYSMMFGAQANIDPPIPNLPCP